jgi:hypothetical protein
MKGEYTEPRADTDCDHDLLVVKVCTRLQIIVKFQKREPRWNLEKLLVQQQKAQDALEEKLGAVKCESGNVEVQRNSIKKCVLDRLAVSDLVGKVDSRARKPWITYELIGNMDE